MENHIYADIWFSFTIRMNRAIFFRFDIHMQNENFKWNKSSVSQLKDLNCQLFSWNLSLELNPKNNYVCNVIFSEHRFANFSVIPIVFHWKCEFKCILVKKWGNQNKSYEAVENAVILEIWRCFTYRMELNRKWCVRYDNSLLSNLDYIEKHRSNKTNILIVHYKSLELELVFFVY